MHSVNVRPCGWNWPWGETWMNYTCERQISPKHTSPADKQGCNFQEKRASKLDTEAQGQDAHQPYSTWEARRPKFRKLLNRVCRASLGAAWDPVSKTKMEQNKKIQGRRKHSRKTALWYTSWFCLIIRVTCKHLWKCGDWTKDHWTFCFPRWGSVWFPCGQVRVVGSKGREWVGACFS